MARRFKFRVRVGSVFWGAGATYRAGDVMIVDERGAASILRDSRRSVELVELIDNRPHSQKRLPD
jgi:hypothetical protein